MIRSRGSPDASPTSRQPQRQSHMQSCHGHHKVDRRKAIHQIQSGQVIVDLCSVVKELVENSLDAGARSIDIRFKNQGLEAIEVQDNGNGISAPNYETLALKHYTSKLSTYDDLTTLRTFGFRGEALSSLCAVSRFSVITCLASDAPKGTKLEFEVSGQLKKTTVVSAQKGTIVTVENLFHNLPVRRQELERNIKREWSRVLSVLGQYACIQTGIKFMVTQQAGRGNKTVVISTKGNATTRDNLVNVFGHKAVAALIPLELKLELELTSVTSQTSSTQNDAGTKAISITGYISRPASGQGRQAPDRQMLYVNSRPCGLPQISKVFNEIYRSYNSTQSPFILANIELDTHSYDVNVSPDKRTILLHDQSLMLDNLKTALAELFDAQDYTVPVSQGPAQKQPAFKQLTIGRDDSTLSSSPAIGSAPDISGGGEISSEAETDSGESNLNLDRTQFKDTSVLRTSMDVDRESVSSISNWTSKNVRARSKEQVARPESPGRALVELSKDKRRLVAKLGKGDQVAHQTMADVQDSSSPTMEARSISPSTSSESNSDEPHHSLHAAEDEQSRDIEGSNLPKPRSNALPATSPPSSHAMRNAYSEARPHPFYRDVAHIKIGEHAITSYAGTISAKKPRYADFQAEPQELEAPETLSSFGETFSQRFAASSTQQRLMQELGDEGNDENIVEASNHPASSAELENDVRDASEPCDPALEEVGIVRDMTQSPSIPDLDKECDAANEEGKRADDEAEAELMIRGAEVAAIVPSEENVLRSNQFLKGLTRKKDATVLLCQTLNTSVEAIAGLFRESEAHLLTRAHTTHGESDTEEIDSERAEEKLSLSISKSDFANMRIVGQFNLGFILASRAAKPTDDRPTASDDLFIIDQHASDEKYNFERLQTTTIVQSQRLVQPKVLNLTALEEEIVFENLTILESNGFVVKVDHSGQSEVGTRCQLVSLPLSRETTFSLTDLEEFLALLSDQPPGSIPRPSKVRKMFAMRACRSSIMIGRALTHRQMAKVVQHMGEIDKPWNCPHGRPTMRHLCGLSVWDDLGWNDDGIGHGVKRKATDWTAFVKGGIDRINGVIIPCTT